MATKVTLKQIAQEVGLSVTSVSLVLNNRPCKISEESKQRIREAARRAHYIPNQIARSLVTRHTHTIGLVVPNIESRFFSRLAKSLELRCRNQGYLLLITNSDDTPANDVELVRLLVNRGVDGLLIVVSDELGADPQLAEDLSNLPIPFVMVDRFIEGFASDKVRFNNEMGGYLATNHLFNHGHKKVACIVNPQSNTGKERLAGYMRAHKERGFELHSEYVLGSEYYISSAYSAAGDLIDMDVTGVFASSDNIALGLLKRLHEQGLHVPEDYSVVSYDNSAADVLFEPALTSIEQNVDELSEAALALLLKRIDELEEGVLSVPQEIVLEPKLIENASVQEL